MKLQSLTGRILTGLISPMQDYLKTWNSVVKGGLKNLFSIPRTIQKITTTSTTTTTTISISMIITTIMTTITKTTRIDIHFRFLVNIKIFLTIAVMAIGALFSIPCSAQVIDPVKFFETTDVLQAKLSMDWGKLVRNSAKPEYYPATFSCQLGDSSISEQIRVIARGHIRKEVCFMPPVKLNFHNNSSPKLSSLNSLKMVCTCTENSNGDQLLLKEYLVYKIYNLITEKSFRVRLMNLVYEDVSPKKKPYTGHAFLIESDKAMAKRSDCIPLKNTRSHSEYTDRDQMTLVAIFQYMIGNTDF